jgi:hypothetical protein
MIEGPGRMRRSSGEYQGNRHGDARRRFEALTVEGPSRTRTFETEVQLKYMGSKEWW